VFPQNQLQSQLRNLLRYTRTANSWTLPLLDRILFILHLFLLNRLLAQPAYTLSLAQLCILQPQLLIQLSRAQSCTQLLLPHRKSLLPHNRPSFLAAPKSALL
jgi:hypothetical protein